MTRFRHYTKITLIVLLSGIVLASAILALDYTGLIALRPLDIDKLYSGYHKEYSMPGPEFVPEENYEEISLDGRFANAALNESLNVTKEEKLAVINKWSRELRPLFGSFMLASAMDYLPHKTAQGILGNSDSARKAASSLGLWAENRLQHTQHYPFFKAFNGKDPWGSLSLFFPVYKKVLPSEMLAKSAYTGKITGKCCSLASLNTAIFAAMGAQPDNIIILRFDSHEIGLVKYENILYVLNNEQIDPLNKAIMDYLLKKNYTAFYSYPLSVVKDFKLTEAVFNSSSSLVDTLAALTHTSERLPPSLLGNDIMKDREQLKENIFGNTEKDEHNRLFSLARYAYQSLYVNEPELYLEASVRAPATKALAAKIKEPEAIFEWIKSNIETAPIFDDYGERIMLGDQVIVFKKGGPKDQAVLAYSLLWLNGYRPTIKITQKTAYVEVDQKLYDARTWSEAGSIDGPVLLTLKRD